ncbi:uncharacterized protein LOC119275837 isoform X1 [Triticum dicoccoides]|uniref:uncharacterized protein LOC119275837 isoform X1 n=2 Tax=Triticum dicoccoides TaxID=85692 RepID=UPI00189091D3|nr:uncharacterized protein LOC119275837 isoform X1 [Triticum dicoccoides]
MTTAGARGRFGRPLPVFRLLRCDRDVLLHHRHHPLLSRAVRSRESSGWRERCWRGRQIKSDAARSFVYAVMKISLALKKLFEDGVVKHEDLFITFKLWFCAPKDVPEAIVATLKELLQHLLCDLVRPPPPVLSPQSW